MKQLMKKLFGGLKMGWPTVIVFAIVAGVYTGAVKLVPELHDTSFQDIAISYEWWVIFAVIIVVNCEKGWEAMLKCFVFFLISQPLVYAVEVAAGYITLDQGVYFYKIWLPMVLFTLPGGFVLSFCKKQNVLGATVLGMANAIQAVLAVHYLGLAALNFPHHLLSGIVCVASIVIMSLCVQEKKRNQAIAIVLPIVLAAAIFVWATIDGRVLF